MASTHPDRPDRPTTDEPADTSPQQEPTAAQIRGDIQRGLTGDKRPGFDPAMAPMETDSEAAGLPLSPEATETARNTQRKPASQHHRSRNFDTAMTMSDPALHRRRPGLAILMPLAAVLLVVGAVLLGLLLR
ncbi:hypothetical protein [Rhizobium straminoryzae]|uniref:hypothetical protein n=1 Tax=Rhizobium straminoryzae TaxID=1387186 RepID=UPI001FEA924C|nr:hypothetical protein [Rhizobium straminoryzae]